MATVLIAGTLRPGRAAETVPARYADIVRLNQAHQVLEAQYRAARDRLEFAMLEWRIAVTDPPGGLRLVTWDEPEEVAR